MLRVHIIVHLKPDVLDVQGQAIQQAVQSAGHQQVESVKMGKSFYLDLDAASKDDAQDEIERLCQETLSNPLIEEYRWEIVE
jgi:phosphoribosylformylglycinamidine synthase